MGKARWFLSVLVLFFLLSRPAIGQNPLHWEATIDSAKAAAGQSHRLVLVFFCAGYCGPCHRMENELRHQPEAVSALEANFVPVKIDYEYYPNTAKQYGITRLPTTVILAPNAQGKVLAVLPEYMPVDEYLSKLNHVAADAKRRDAGVLAQVQASPAIGARVVLDPSPASGGAPAASSAKPANPVPTVPVVAGPLPPAGPAQNQTLAAPPPAAGGSDIVHFAVAANTGNAPTASPTAAVAMAPQLSGNRPLDDKQPAATAKRPAHPLVGLDGFCPVQLAENFRWQPGKKDWGAIHRGRTYLFAGQEEQRRFLAQPDRYAPVSSGDDVVVLLEQGRAVSGHREHGVKFDGHVYLFASENTLDRFQSNPRYYAERALQAMHSTSQTAAVR